MIRIRSTKIDNPENLKIKICVYGEAGLGKTVLCSTAPRPLIMSAENGLLSLAALDIPYTLVTSVDEVQAVYEFLQTDEAKEQFDTICLDSISEIGEVLLVDMKAKEKDPRAAYGRMQDAISGMMRNFRDLKDYHVVFTAKQERQTDDFTGVTKYMPSMPGRVLTKDLPYVFDELFVMRIGEDPEGKSYRYIQPNPEVSYDAKDRSGALGTRKDGTYTNQEPPNLTKIINKLIKHIGKKPQKPAKQKPTIIENSTPSETKEDVPEVKQTA